MIFSGLRSLNITFVKHFGAAEGHLWQVLYSELVLKIEGVLTPYQGLSILGFVGAGQGSLDTFFVI